MQLLITLEPIDVTDGGMLIFCNKVQSLNAFEGIAFKDGSTIICVMCNLSELEIADPVYLYGITTVTV